MVNSQQVNTVLAKGRISLISSASSISVLKTLSRLWKNKSKQTFLLFLTGFLLSQIFLLNILLSQHPQGGWVTFIGNITTPTVMAVLLLSLLVCLVTLWRSTWRSTALTHPNRSNHYSSSKPITFIKFSPE